jgi:hypothetical protein
MENREAITDLINNIENGTLADAEQVFNDIMDLKAGEIVNARREEMAAGTFDMDSEETQED